MTIHRLQVIFSREEAAVRRLGKHTQDADPVTVTVFGSKAVAKQRHDYSLYFFDLPVSQY